MKVVLSIRIDKELKEAMEKIPINWREEIENFIRSKVRDYLKRKFLEEARVIRSKIPELEISHATLIREDRDAR
ncbi:MAG: type II toxin-antitoxin system VapB family antitoxin [Candidatus Baldrarchaeia archaeon]